MKYLVKLFVVTFILSICTYASAEEKITYIDLKYVLNNSKAGKGAQDYLKKTFKRIIKKGWPGKIESVLDRQTDLVVLSFYGLYEYCARTKKKERKAISEDFINMLNLHLQDRLFF